MATVVLNQNKQTGPPPCKVSHDLILGILGASGLTNLIINKWDVLGTCSFLGIEPNMFGWMIWFISYPQLACLVLYPLLSGLYHIPRTYHLIFNG